MPRRAGIEQKRGERLRRRENRAWTPLGRALTACGDRWTLAIALQLAGGRLRVTYLRRRLPAASTGVLERHVQQMVELGLVTRTRFKEMPPRVELELTDAGRALLPIARALARWGMRHQWSPPRERERTDLGALLCLLPALLEEQTDLPDGSVEALVTDADPPIRCRYLVTDGRLRADRADEDGGDRADGRADEDGRLRADGTPGTDRSSVSVRGDAAAWVAALGPACDCGRLRFDGDERLARRILAALPRA